MEMGEMGGNFLRTGTAPPAPAIRLHRVHL